MLLTFVFTASLGKYWIQPELEACNLNASVVTAWCYPTAAANLLANYGKWNSPHRDKVFPNTYGEGNCSSSGQAYEHNVSFETGQPWADLMYHQSDDSLNIGSFVKTSTTAGTNLKEGEKGLQTFLDGRTDPEWDVTVTYTKATPGNNDMQTIALLPDKLFLLHIGQACIESAEQFTAPAAYSEGTFTPGSTNIEHGHSELISIYGSTLGHTVCVYDNHKDGTMNVASGVKSERHSVSGSSTLWYWAGSVYNFSAGESCIEGHTEVKFKLADAKTEESKLSTGAIIGIVAGGVAVLVIIYLVVRRYRSNKAFGYQQTGIMW